MNFFELFRYAIVGAVSFLFDLGILMSFYNAWGQYITNGLYIATVLGFVGGIILNTYLSVRFVFMNVKGDGRHYIIDWHDYLAILIIGGTGLVITEWGMYIGVEIMNIYYLLSKMLVTTIVFLWNYWARRKFVFYRECN
ncbi:GtrA family protein [Selenomonas ruminantium]|uniref:Putative flippase GtrA (Transmembrane translocase of bactoprenol-linked glucose) n=1 Tax=Selenomonas ruminantium TaxID=971 RepID=A0A1H3YUH6_SELRU|nr:GtrA family protein [Selenomonas ruminantium]SEA14851.1 Putative flippase GtrA (transmembrane translocase of bactoprenol-linked glucose) [Selenomonas ruminantium]